MHKLRRKYKYERLVELLEEDVYSSFKPGDQFTSELELCETFNYNRQTVHKAIIELARKGLLEMRGRSGTFVRDFKENGFDNRLTAVSMPVKTHLWDRIYLHISSVAAEYNQLMLTVDFSSTVENQAPTSKERERHFTALRKALNMQPRNLIYGGSSDIGSVFKHLGDDTKKFRNLILLNTQDNIDRDFFPHIGLITQDHRSTWQLMTENAFKSGYKHICLYFPHQSASNTKTLDLVGNCFTTKSKRDIEIAHFYENDPEALKKLVEYCRQHNPTAVLTTYDYGAHLACGALQISGLSIPDQVGIYGINNTPWAEKDSLTSIGYDPELWSHEIFRCINELDAGKHFIEIKIPPKLHQRSSTLGIT